MSVIDGLRHRMQVWAHRSTYERGIEDEMRFHLSLDAARQPGPDAVTSAWSAKRRFGNVTYMKEESRSAAGLAALDGVIQDARHLVRSLARSPGFAIAAVVTLALGIGTTTATLSIVDHVLFHSLPFREPDRLMMMLERDEHGGLRPPSFPTVADWKRDPDVQRAFDGMTFIRGDGVWVGTAPDRESVGGGFVGREFFPMLGARPVLGRTLNDDDQRPSAPPVVVLAYGLWQRRFGGDPSIVGRQIQLDSAPATVVGVMPAGAAYPTFAELWEPITRYRHQEILARRGLHADSRTMARRRIGVDSSAAIAMMRTVSARLAVAYPAEQARWSAAMIPLSQEIVAGDARPTLLMLAAASLLVLLLACSNVANLLFARMSTRVREISVRSALGASRTRLMRQLMTESTLLAVVGGMLGTAMAAITIRLARSLPTSRLPRADELALDGRVLAVAVGASLITAVVCGIWPALQATRPVNAQTLRSGTPGSGNSRSDARLRRVLVTLQFALALTLLVGAGLLLQSFRRASSVPVGFDPTGLVTTPIHPSQLKYGKPQDAAALYGRLLEAMRAVPGVTDVALIQHFPLGGAAITSSIDVDGQSSLDKSSNQVYYRTVSAGYLRTMKITLSEGHWFTDDDMRSPEGAFVVNAALAKRYWPGQTAIGKRVTVRRSSQARPDFGQPLAGSIVGVIDDVHQFGQDAPAEPEVYVPYTLEVWPWVSLVARTGGTSAASATIAALRRAVQSVDPALMEKGQGGDGNFGPVTALLSRNLEPRRFALSLTAVFAGCALVLAAVGLYGVVAYGVTQRTREMGVRKALGATDGMIAVLIVKESMWLTGIGILLGCAGAWGSAHLIRSLLFQTGPADPVAFASTIGVLTIVALVATYLPARRATRLDATIAMRGD